LTEANNSPHVRESRAHHTADTYLSLSLSFLLLNFLFGKTLVDMGDAPYSFSLYTHSMCVCVCNLDGFKLLFFSLSCLFVGLPFQVPFDRVCLPLI
jgi:hypothetical protein